MNRHITKLARAAALFTMGILASCAGEDGQPDRQRVLLVTEDAEEAINEGDFTEADNPTITRVTDGLDESFADFIREPNGSVGIVATGRYLGQMAALVDGDGASALEVFLAIAPEEEVPQELYDNHDELADVGKVPEEPRQLVAFRETVNDEICDHALFNDWWSDWYPGYDDNDEGHGSVVDNDFFVVTGFSAQRALAICFRGGIPHTGSTSLSTWNGSAWQIFYTDNSLPFEYGVGYRSSAIFLGQYRQRAWTAAPYPSWQTYWGGAY